MLFDDKLYAESLEIEQPSFLEGDEGDDENTGEGDDENTSDPDDEDYFWERDYGDFVEDDE